MMKFVFGTLVTLGLSLATIGCDDDDPIDDGVVDDDIVDDDVVDDDFDDDVDELPGVGQPSGAAGSAASAAAPSDPR